MASADDAVDHGIEQVGELRRGKHVVGIGARGDDGAPQSGALRLLHVAHGPLVRLDSLLADQLEHALILVVADALDRVGVRWIVGLAVGQTDIAGLEEGSHPVLARHSVHVVVVITDFVEGDKVPSRLLRPPAQEGVEGLLPRCRVDLGGLREHAVHVEQKAIDVRWQPKHPLITNTPSDSR